MAGQVTPSPPRTGTSTEDLGAGVKVSQILGTVGATSGAAAALAPFTAPITVPLGILSSLAGGIVGLFGGRLTAAEMQMIGQIKMRVDERKKMGLQ